MIETRACRTCGADQPQDKFPVKDIRNGVRRYRSDCNRCHLVKRKTPRSGLAPKCEVCSAEYRPTYDNQRTCSRECGGRLNMYDRTGQWPSTPLVYSSCSGCGLLMVGRSTKARCDDCPQPKYYRPRTGGQRTTTCGHCGVAITEIAKRGRPRSSCDVCLANLEKIYRKNAKHKRRTQTKTGERIIPAEIFARDRNTCQLCHKRLAMTKAVPHPRAPTLDHVVPLAEGGEHTRANVQAAHFECNSAKQAGGSQQLALVG